MNSVQTAPFSALADPTRLSIIDMLAKGGELSAGEISSRFGSTASAISQHLKVLRDARLVVAKRRAQQRIYQLDAGTMAELEQWLSVRTREWNARLDTFDNYVQQIK